MRPLNMKNATLKTQLFLALMVAAAMSLAQAAFAAVPGLTGTGSTAGTFNLTAQDAYLNQPDGNAVYSWGYGCTTAPPAASFVPKGWPTTAFAPACNTMQVPGPTMVVTEGSTITINLTNNLPTAAGNTSILFPGLQVTSTCAGTTANPQGLLACEAAPGQMITYTVVATTPGTHAYYSGTQGDLQIEMGLYGAIVVLPATPGGSASACPQGITNLYGTIGPTGVSTGVVDYGTHAGIQGFPEQDFRLSTAAFDHPKSCYDREYLFQWAEMDTRIHTQAAAQVQATAGCTAGNPGCSLNVQTEPYHPAYFLINGRSMPDDMDPNYASEYPHQPYNGNPHIHPGELMLIRTIGQGRWQHPFHEHANHVRILARDGNMILSPTNPASSLAGSLMFNTDTTPGEAFDGIFYFSGRGLNWDPYGHHPQGTGNGFTTFPISAISISGSTVTVTISGAQVPVSGSQIAISGVTPAAFNGAFDVVGATAGSGGTAASPTSTITYFIPSNPPASGTSGKGGTATVSIGSNNAPNDPLSSLTCTPDANGYNTGGPGSPGGTNVTAIQESLNYFEWCQDHNKPVQVAPFGDVAQGGPATLPDPNVFTNGAWYGGSPYLGPDATLRGSHQACDTLVNANCTDLQPSNVQANPASERGWAFMWHSHNEREITTNNVFPGGMLMMMLVDSREFPIDESK